MTFAKKISLGALIVVVALLACLSWILATEGGARWVLARAQAYLPPELTLGQVRGSLIGGLGFASVDWNSETLDVAIREVAIEVEIAQLLSRHLNVRSLDVAEIGIAARGAADTASESGLPTIDLPLEFSIDSSSLRKLTFTREDKSQVVDEIRANGSIKGSRLDITRLAVRSEWLNADLAGRFTFEDDYPGRVQADWQWRASPSLELVGQLEVYGDLRRYEVALDTGASFDDLPAIEVHLEGVLDPEKFRVSRIDAGSDLGRLSASGDVRWQPAIAFNAEYALEDLDPSVASGLLAGSVSARGLATGEWADAEPSVAVEVTALEGRINDQPLGGGGNFSYADAQFEVSKGRVQLGSNRIAVDGAIGDRILLDAQAELPVLHELLPDASGSLSASIALRGSQDRPEGHLEASGTDLSWSDYAIANVLVDAAVYPARDFAVSVNLANAVAADNKLDLVNLEATGKLDGHALRAEATGSGSRVVTEVAGAYVDGSWTGAVRTLSIDNPLAGSWSLRDPADFLVSRDSVSLSRGCLDSATETGEACIQAAASRDRPSTFDLTITSLPISVLPLALPAEVTPGGFVDVRAKGSAVGNRLTGEGSIALRDAKLDAVVDDETVSAAFTTASAEVSVIDNRAVASLRLALADGVGSTAFDVTVDDILYAGSAVAGRGTIEINDMSLFAVLLPDIANPSGTIGGSLDIAGSFGEPEFAGALAISDGGFGFRKTGIEISDIDARVVQLSAGRLQLEGSARSGDGEIAISGDTWASADAGIRSEFLITGQDFELSRLPDWQVSASPSIAVVFDDRVTTVTGNLFIPATDVRVKDIPDAAESSSPDAIVHRSDGQTTTARRRIDVDIAVGLGDEVRFAGFGLSTDIEGAVRIRGGTHAPYTGTGRLSLRDGRYEAYGQDLEIERGQLIFNGPLDNPQLDVRAIRRETDVTAGIQISGTPTQLQSSLFSEPPLGDAETLSYLLTGRPLSSATSEGDGDVLNSAAFALGVSSAGNIVTQVRTGLGLDTLAVEGGADDGRLIAGKRIGSRLFVEYGYGLIDKLGTLLLRYQLNDRIILESRTGTISNFDILYRVKKK